MKTIILTVIMSLLFSSVALATTVQTDYNGMGDLEMTTTLISPVGPDITDSVEIHTGCAGACCGCCCYPDVFGQYDGAQVVSNNPFVASGHIAEVEDGCVEINQYYTDVIGEQTIYTTYYTYFKGTGTAQSFVYVVPGAASSHQSTNGTGDSFVSFSQIAFIGDDLDFATNYGGQVWACSPGSVELMGQYYYSGGQIYYNNQLGLYCKPLGDRDMYAFLYAEGTDHFGLCGTAGNDDWGFGQDINIEGSSDYGFSVNSNYDFDFNFEMELG